MDELYSIKGQTLTDISDALRRKHGETEWIDVYTLEPSTTISKTSNAIDFTNKSGNYPSNQEVYDVIQIFGAQKIAVKMAFKFSNYNSIDDDFVCIASGKHDKDTFPAVVPKYSKNSTETMVELEFNNTDTVTFYLHTDNAGIGNTLGYYAECTGYDADGNVIENPLKQVWEKEEVKRTYKSSEIAQAIDDIEQGTGLPEENLKISGNCSYMFYGGAWNWFLEEFKDVLSTDKINASDYMFYGCKVLELPFDINFADNGCNVNMMFGLSGFLEIPSIDFKQAATYRNADSLFRAVDARKIGTVKNLYPSSTGDLFYLASYIHDVPEFENLNLSRIQTYASSSCDSMFHSCYSLRSVPEDFIKQFYGTWTSIYGAFLYTAFTNCYSLDEIRGLPSTTGKINSNMFGTSATSSTFGNCTRLKDIMFLINDDGTPCTATWKSQVIDLSLYVGFAPKTDAAKRYITGYNSGITEDKEVKDDTTYQALKNDPDWFTCNPSYSRYNHDSAVNTINTLPDTSAYGTNTIKFKGIGGELTDGGACNTLTEEEIAVATAKGWTVTLV